MNNRNFKSEHGQILVIVALIMIGLFAMLALILDGGMTYAKRRQAQNAADAGALAGARTLCTSKDEAQAISEANRYATTLNGATTADVQIDDDGMVWVTAMLPFRAFFAQLIGRPQILVQASAAAGCFPPTTGRSVLPVAWACRPPISEALSTSDDCQEQAIDEDTLNHYLDPADPVNNPMPPSGIHPELYVVMNSNSDIDDLSSVCISGGGWLNCDLDGDGEDDLVANADRSWLDLDGGGGGASSLISWINGGFTGQIFEHTWVGGQTGVEGSVFQAAGDHVGEIVLVPVFNMICDGDPATTSDCSAHADDQYIYSSGTNTYYHVITFGAFYITCVDAPGVPGPECPGHRAASDLGVIANNTRTIEGYFLEGIFSQLGGGDPGSIDIGVYTLKLYH